MSDQDWDKLLTKWSQNPDTCPCGVPNMKCENYKMYGYNCVGVRFVGDVESNYKGFQKAPFGFKRQDCPLPIGPIREKI
jgi:hypothetical protein